jgi:hypothetical protein
LWKWVELYLGLRVPTRAVCAGHAAPFEYLRRAYFEPGSDLVVWAPRGGGKTSLGAAATILDLLHKPGCAVRILGGSMEQSLRMWEYLLPHLREYARDRVEGRIGARGARLVDGGSVGAVPQSERAVRGMRVQKLRCDEVELFDPAVWRAAQLVTKTKALPPGSRFEEARGVVEAFSTMHAVGGLMEGVVEAAEGAGTPVLKWCLMEVLEKCPPARECGSCALWEECGGRLKEAGGGFVSIEDALAMKRRVSREAWETEMLCRRPRRDGAVFRSFDVGVHVREEMPAPGAGAVEEPKREGLYCGVDFGFKNPFVCLWIQRDRWGRSFVVDEYVRAEVELDGHISEIKSRGEYGAVRRVCCDPAGSARNEQTGVSNVARLRKAGFRVACKGSRIQDGLEMVRAGLRNGGGEASLFIHPRCRELVKAMRAYRYGEGRAEVPEKDGADHLVDALRYYFVSRDHGEVEGGWY